MNLTFANGTAQQQQWCRDVVAQSRIAWSAVDMHVTVSFVDDPDPQGRHRDYADTDAGGGVAAIKIRKDIGDTNADFALFTDVFHHELGHAYMALLADQAASLAPLFYKGSEQGAVAKWAGDDPNVAWAEHIVEGAAETFKDVFAGVRKWNNRAYWRLPESNFEAWLSALGAAGGRFTETHRFGGATSGGTPNDYWPHGVPPGASPDTYQGAYLAVSGASSDFPLILSGSHGPVSAESPLTLTADFNNDYPGPPFPQWAYWLPPTIDPAGNPLGGWGVGWAPWGAPELDVWRDVLDSTSGTFLRYEPGLNPAVGAGERLGLFWRGQFWQVDLYFYDGSHNLLEQHTWGAMNQDVRAGVAGVTLNERINIPAGAAFFALEKQLNLPVDTPVSVNFPDDPKRDVIASFEYNVGGAPLSAPWPYGGTGRTDVQAAIAASRASLRKVVGGTVAARIQISGGG